MSVHLCKPYVCVPLYNLECKCHLQWNFSFMKCSEYYNTRPLFRETIKSNCIFFCSFNVTGSRLLLHWRNTWLRKIYCLQTTFSRKQWQWDFPLQEECLVHYVSVYFSWLWPVQTSTNQLRPVTGMLDKKEIVWLFCVTFNLDFDQGGYVMQIEWTKALCNNCQPML